MPTRITQTDHQLLISSIAGFISWLLAYVRVDVEIMVIFTIFVVIDTVTGVIRVRVLDMDNGTHNYSNSHLVRGVVTKIFLIMLPLMAGALGAASGKDVTVVVDTMIWWLILKEAYSFVSTIHFLIYDKPLPEWNVMAKIGKAIRGLGGDKDV